MRQLTIRPYLWLNQLAHRITQASRSDRGAITAEYLMWGAVAAAAVVTLGSRLFDDVLDGVIDRIRDALA